MTVFVAIVDVGLTVVIEILSSAIYPVLESATLHFIEPGWRIRIVLLSVSWLSDPRNLRSHLLISQLKPTTILTLLSVGNSRATVLLAIIDIRLTMIV